MTTRDLIAPPETTDNWGILNENEAIQKDIVYLEYNVLVSFDPLMIEPPLIPSVQFFRFAVDSECADIAFVCRNYNRSAYQDCDVFASLIDEEPSYDRPSLCLTYWRLIFFVDPSTSTFNGNLKMKAMTLSMLEEFAPRTILSHQYNICMW